MTQLARSRIKKVRKRSGRFAAFNSLEIQRAIKKAILRINGIPKDKIVELAETPICQYNQWTGKVNAADRKAAIYSALVVAELEKMNADGSFTPTIEQIQNVVIDTIHNDARRECPVVDNPLELWSAYMTYMYDRHFERGRILPKAEIRATRSAYESMKKKITEWNMEHDCLTINGLNEWVAGRNGKDISRLISMAENSYLEQLRRVARIISDVIREREIRAVIVCGPSSSGKTTTAKLLGKVIQELYPEMSFRAMEVDRYFRTYPEYESPVYLVDGELKHDYNYETPYAYRMDYLNFHLSELMKGRKIMMPKYYFGKGWYADSKVPFQLNKGQILLIDCLHALFPPLTEAIPEEQKLKIYIESMNPVFDNHRRGVRWTDIRMMKRMLRDVRVRGHSIYETAWHWHFVRKGECFMFPYLPTVDAVINGGMSYELPVLKHFLEPELLETLPIFERNIDLFDGRRRIERVLRLFQQLDSATSEQITLIPKGSVVREFIGGQEL